MSDVFITRVDKKRSQVKTSRTAFRTTILLASLITAYPGFITAAHAATANGDSTGTAAEGKVELKTIQKRYEKLKVGQKNITSAMSIITKKDIEKARAFSNLKCNTLPSGKVL